MDIGFNLMQVKARPPYVRFEKRPMERRLETGIKWTDVDFALVTPHGGKDTVEKVVSEWFPRLKEEVRQGRFPQEWLDAYQRAYEAWKNDQEPPLNGTDIRNWPVLSPAETKMLTQLRVLTVEDLAEANEELLGRIGMGARSLKDKAKDWLQAAHGNAPLIAQLDSMRQVNANLQSRIEVLQQQVNTLLAQAAQRPSEPVPALLMPLEDRLSQSRPNTREEDLVGSAIDEALE